MEAIQYQLGPLTQHTTYEAEIIGVILALHLIHRDGRAGTASIRLDNQAVVQALASRKTKPAQSLLNGIHDLCDKWQGVNR